jgi:glyoxylase-like metal-dependent hydrolase (beta-lactamase superfamily II)
VVDGLRKLGLDPGEITHVVISHGHGDHHGGAKYLQDQFGATIVMGAPDWDLVERSTRDPIPRRDLVATDEMEIRLGETTVTLYLTPGHTAGTVSTMIEVRDQGRSHLAASWGGTSLFATTSVESIQAYIDSAVRYQQLIETRGADVLVANHTSFDRTPDKVAALADRQPGDAHPYVIGTDAVRSYVKVAEECARAELARRLLNRQTLRPREVEGYRGDSGRSGLSLRGQVPLLRQSVRRGRELWVFDLQQLLQHLLWNADRAGVRLGQSRRAEPYAESADRRRRCPDRVPVRWHDLTSSEGNGGPTTDVLEVFAASTRGPVRVA